VRHILDSESRILNSSSSYGAARAAGGHRRHLALGGCSRSNLNKQLASRWKFWDLGLRVSRFLLPVLLVPYHRYSIVAGRWKELVARLLVSAIDNYLSNSRQGECKYFEHPNLLGLRLPSPLRLGFLDDLMC
jgi:hypothetical protein